MDHGEGLAPVALSTEEPVPQLVADGRFALALLLQPLVHLLDGGRSLETVQEVGVHRGADSHEGLPREVSSLHHLHDGQVEGLGEGVVALVVSGDGHDGAGSVAGQDVVGDPDGDVLAVDGILGVGADEDPGLLLAFGLPGTLALAGSGVDIGVHGGPGIVAGDPRDEWMLGCQHHVGGAEEGVGTGGEDLDQFAVATHHRELDPRALGSPDPLLLHLLDAIRPVDLLQILEQSLRVVGDAQHPLTHGQSHHRVTAALALSADHLFVGEDGAQGRTPVHRHLGFVGQAPFVELGEDPLGPFHVLGIGGVDLAGPVVAEPQAPELAPVVVDVLLGGLTGMGPRLDGVLLGGQAEGVPAHRVQHVETAHSLVARDGVGADVALRVPDVESLTGRVGEHVEHVELGSGGIERRLEGLVLDPVALPVGLDGLGVVGHGRWKVPVLPAVVNAAPARVELHRSRSDLLALANGEGGGEGTGDLPGLRPHR